MNNQEKLGLRIIAIDIIFIFFFAILFELGIMINKLTFGIIYLIYFIVFLYGGIKVLEGDDPEIE